MLVHSFDRFYIVTKFILPSIEDIKFSRLIYDHTCTYMNKEYVPNTDSRKYLTELKTYCNKIKPFLSYYRKLINSYNKTAHNILENEIKPLLPQISRQNMVLSPHKCQVSLVWLMKGYQVSFNKNERMLYRKL